MGILQNLIEREYEIQTWVRINPEIDEATTTAQQVLFQNPDRIAFSIMNLGTENVALAPDERVAQDYGILLASNGGYVSMNWKEDYSLVGYDWWVVTASGTSKLLVLEVIGR